MINQRVGQIPFWTPVLLPEGITKKSKINDFAWKLGSLADRYFYLGNHINEYDLKKVDNLEKYEFRLKARTEKSTLEKVASYVTFFVLAPVAIIAKLIYKNSLRSLIMTSDFNKVITEKKIGNTKIILLSGDILNENTSAIVNAANKKLVAGAGVCGAIHKTAGSEPFNECQEILKNRNLKKLPVGGAVLTSAGNLKDIPNIIHAVGPIYSDNEQKKKKQNEQLAAAYKNSLELLINPSGPNVSQKVTQKTGRTISFPSISTGFFRFPTEKASEIAINAVKEFISKHPNTLDEVHFVFLPNDDKDFVISNHYLKALKSI